MEKFSSTFKAEFIVFGKVPGGLGMHASELPVTFTAKASAGMNMGSFIVKDAYSTFSVKIPTETHETLFGKLVPTREMGRRNEVTDYTYLPKTCSAPSLEALANKMMQLAYDAQFQNSLTQVFVSPKFIVVDVSTESGKIHSYQDGTQYGNKASVGISYAVMHHYNGRFFTLEGRLVKDVKGDPIEWTEELEASIKNAVEELSGVANRIDSFKSKMLSHNLNQ
jgi:hypothetical protein